MPTKLWFINDPLVLPSSIQIFLGEGMFGIYFKGLVGCKVSFYYLGKAQCKMLPPQIWMDQPLMFSRYMSTNVCTSI